MEKIIRVSGKYLLTAALIVIVLLFRGNVYRKPLLAEDGSEFCKAVVIENDNLLVQESDSGQEVGLLLKSGKHSGQRVRAYAMNGYLYGASCKKGQHVIAQVSGSGDDLSVNVYNYDREGAMAVLLFAFAFSVWLVGGKKGIHSLIALVFTCIVIIGLYIPLIYVGVSPFLSAVCAVLLVTFVTYLLIDGMSRKSISAMVGTIGGVVCAGVIAAIFGRCGYISGMNVDEIETLLFIQQNSHIDIGGMLFSSILIASLGAVMDVAMSVSSSMTEICDKVPNITRKELFRSGLRIGRDMIGTMSNTLILAFVGGSLNLVMIIYAYQYPLHQVLNMYSLGIEWMKGIAGTMGIVFTVPLTAAAASYFLLRNAGVSQSKA